jgi:large subunit ribosomal protein L23
MKYYDIIKHPLSTEKSIRLMESENKLVFAVVRKANKIEIRKAIEEFLKVKVESVKTYITPKGEKRAYVKFTPEYLAIDVATNLGIL